jgi:hypothetical protein
MEAPTAQPLRSFSDLLEDSIGFYRRNITKVLGLSAVPGACFILFALVAPQIKPGEITPSAIILSIVFGVIYVVAAYLASIGLYYFLGGQDKSVGELLSLGVSKLGPVLLVVILSSLITTAGFLLFIIPGVIFSVWFTFVTQVVVLENKGTMEALSQSRAYVRGRWWAIFGRLFLLGVLIVLAGILFSIVTAILSGIIGPSAQILNNAFSVFVFTPIATIFVYYLYRSAAHAH